MASFRAEGLCPFHPSSLPVGVRLEETGLCMRSVIDLVFMVSRSHSATSFALSLRHKAGGSGMPPSRHLTPFFDSERASASNSQGLSLREPCSGGVGHGIAAVRLLLPGIVAG